MNLQLTTAEQYRRNWADLTPEQIAEDVAAGTLRICIQATNVQQILAQNYQGSVAVRSVYILGPDDVEENIVGVHHDWVRVNDIPPDVVHATVIAGVPLEPRVIAALMQVNDGEMPVIRPPKPPVVDPPAEEEPETPPTEPEEQPVEPESPEEPTEP